MPLYLTVRLRLMLKAVKRCSSCDGVFALTIMSLGLVIPGFVDVHAHWEGFSNYYPARSWEMETFLAYGVTTLHK